MAVSVYSKLNSESIDEYKHYLNYYHFRDDDIEAFAEKYDISAIYADLLRKKFKWDQRVRKIGVSTENPFEEKYAKQYQDLRMTGISFTLQNIEFIYKANKVLNNHIEEALTDVEISSYEVLKRTDKYYMTLLRQHKLLQNLYNELEKVGISTHEVGSTAPVDASSLVAGEGAEKSKKVLPSDTEENQEPASASLSHQEKTLSYQKHSFKKEPRVLGNYAKKTVKSVTDRYPEPKVEPNHIEEITQQPVDMHPMDILRIRLDQLINLEDPTDEQQAEIDSINGEMMEILERAINGE
jgi:hypothetical protein